MIDVNEKIKLNHVLAEEKSESSQPEESKKTYPMEISLADIKCFGKLGEGSSGVVEKAIHVPTKTKLALKVFPE